MNMLEQKILKLMELPLKYQSGDCPFTAGEVHYGLLKVMPPPLSLDEVKMSLDTLYTQGRVTRAQRAKDGIYDSVYSLVRQQKDEATMPAALPEAIQQTEPIMTKEKAEISLVGLMRELDHVEGVLYNFMVSSHMEHGAEENVAVDAADLRMASGWNGDADDPEPPNEAFARKFAARKKILIGLQALIEGRIAALCDEECVVDNDIAIIAWRSERVGRVDELGRLLAILKEMEASE